MVFYFAEYGEPAGDLISISAGEFTLCIVGKSSVVTSEYATTCPRFISVGRKCWSSHEWLSL